MAILVLALGALMSICGIASIFYGSGILTDKDWVSVLGGVSALSGGLVVVALGLVHQTLLEMRDALRSNVATGRAAAGKEGADVAAATMETGATDGPSRRHDGLDFDPGRDVAPSHAEAAPLETRQAPSLMTPELESGMLAAILSSRDGHVAENHPASLDAVTANSHAMEETHAPSEETDADHALHADTREFPFPNPHLSDPHGETAEPVEPSRFSVSFKGQHATEPSHAEPQHDEQPHAEQPRAEQPRAEQPRAEQPRGQPKVPDQDGPAMDDWLDRAFSALDEEIPPLTGHRSNGGEPERQAAHHDHELAHADLAPAPRVEEPYPEPAPPTDAAVIGRYEADGTLYVMFADGSIEAQSAAGIFRFGSMAELKAHIESVT